MGKQVSDSFPLSLHNIDKNPLSPRLLIALWLYLGILSHTHITGEDIQGQKQHRIEVEEKFPLHDSKALQEAIQRVGGKLKAKQVFTDIYYDLPQGIFRAANVWLRERGGISELKIPVTSMQGEGESKACVYTEVRGTEEIVKCLVQTFPVLEVRLHEDKVSQ